MYRPPHHKNVWRAKARVITIGPKAQALLREFFAPDIADYLFSPHRAVADLNAERSAKRKTPRYPSHTERNVGKRPKDPNWRKARRWHPNQLRHSFATKVRKGHGLEAAQVLLGHSKADVTQVYAVRNEQLASAVAAKFG